MARYKDPVVAEIKTIRHKISRRLAEADKKGRLLAELRAIDRRADQVLEEIRRSTRNRRSRKSTRPT